MGLRVGAQGLHECTDGSGTSQEKQDGSVTLFTPRPPLPPKNRVFTLITSPRDLLPCPNDASKQSQATAPRRPRTSPLNITHDPTHPGARPVLQTRARTCAVGVGSSRSSSTGGSCDREGGRRSSGLRGRDGRVGRPEQYAAGQCQSVCV